MTAPKLIEGVTGTDTFEDWFNKTNEIIDFNNKNNGLIRVELDYNGYLQPNGPVGWDNESYQLTSIAHHDERYLSGNKFGPGQPIFNIPMPNTNFTYLSETDLVHCNFLARINGATGMLVGSFTDIIDGWGGESSSDWGGAPTDHPWQRNLLGMVAKIHSWNTSTKKVIADICLPGGTFVIKYSDLTQYDSRNTRYFYDNALLGGHFFLGFTSDHSTGAKYGGLFQITPFCESNTPTNIIDNAHYLTIIPYNDPDQHLQIYLDPRAPHHKLISVTGFTAAIQTGSCAILGYAEYTTANKLQNISIPERVVQKHPISSRNMGETPGCNVFSEFTKYNTNMLKITFIPTGATYATLADTAVVIVGEGIDNIHLIYTGSNYSVYTNGGIQDCSQWNIPEGNIFLSALNNKLYVVDTIHNQGGELLIQSI